MKLSSKCLFSIVIPTYGRPDRLRLCLESIRRLDFPCDQFEVIVVDDGGAVSLDSVISTFTGKFRLTLLKKSHAGPGLARNQGASQATGEYVVFTDDDCMPNSDWLIKLKKYFTDTPVCVIGGKTVNYLQKNLFSTASQLLADYLGGYYNQTPMKARFFTSNNLAFPRRSLIDMGGFHSVFLQAGGEDREIIDRWLHYDGSTIYAADVVVQHAHPLSLLRFWKQHFNYGRGAFHFHRLRAQRMGQYKIKMEPTSFYFNLIRYPFLKQKNISALMLSFFLALSQISNAIGFFWEGIVFKRKSQPASFLTEKA